MIVFIPARGGSKRIIGKNKKNFGASPIIQGTIKKLISFEIFEKIIVSTDDLEIMQLAIDAGAECFFVRPPVLATDYATTNEVVRHAIEEIRNKYGTDSDYCCIYPTSILIEKEYISKGFELYELHKDKFIFSCKKYKHPIERAFYINDENFATFYYPEKTKKRTQDLKESYYDAGQFYIANEKTWLSNEEILIDNSVPVLIPQYAGIDIDDQEDWILAEHIYEIRNNLT